MLDQNNFINQFNNLTLGMRGVLVCFTGGVDSALLLNASAKVLKENLFAVTFTSTLQSKKNLRLANEIAKNLHIPHIIYKYNPLSFSDIKFNTKNRCYVCKSQMFCLAREIAKDKNLYNIFDGSHIEDDANRRPGMKALGEYNIRSPLRELGLSKANIRSLAKTMGLQSWYLPSESCLATRFPAGYQLNELDLKKLEEAELSLSEYGLKSFRIRPYDTPPKIVVSIDEMHVVEDIGVNNLFNKMHIMGYSNLNYLIYTQKGYDFQLKNKNPKLGAMI